MCPTVLNHSRTSKNDDNIPPRGPVGVGPPAEGPRGGKAPDEGPRGGGAARRGPGGGYTGVGTPQKTIKSPDRLYKAPEY